MYHHMRVIRAGLLGIIFSWLVMLAVLLGIETWSRTLTYPESSFVIMFTYSSIGILICIASWIRGRPSLIYASLHALAWLVPGAISIGVGPWLGPLPMLIALLLSTLLFARVKPIMRWLYHLDTMVDIEARPKEASMGWLHPMEYQRGHQPQASAEPVYWEAGQAFANPRPVEKTAQIQQMQ